MPYDPLEKYPPADEIRLPDCESPPSGLTGRELVAAREMARRKVESLRRTYTRYREYLPSVARPMSRQELRGLHRSGNLTADATRRRLDHFLGRLIAARVQLRQYEAELLMLDIEPGELSEDEP